MNCNACDLLSAKGYNGRKMKVRLNIKKASSVAKPVTVPHTTEQQEVLEKAFTHSLRFLETGGGILGCDDAFIASHCHNCRIERAAKEKDKAAWKAAEDNERKELNILETMESAKADANSKPRIGVKELRVLLVFYDVEKKEILQMKVKEMTERYNKIKEDNTPTKKFKNWTDANKEELTQLMREDVCIDETLLGKERRIKFKEDTDRVFKMVEERGKDEMIKLIEGASSLVLMAASLESESESIESKSESTASASSFDPSKILLSQSS